MNNFNYLFDTRLPRPGVIIISDELAVWAGTSDRDGRMSCRLARPPASPPVGAQVRAGADRTRSTFIIQSISFCAFLPVFTWRTCPASVTGRCVLVFNRARGRAEQARDSVGVSRLNRPTSSAQFSFIVLMARARCSPPTISV